ncbi:uncharacterized protein LOC115692375 isoform X2 [Syzygium oleosum]|uniref:uncharacterized protein LOC115692375 isoform X2 n=1 Tax=Syzygium oleosum TaxID=219896 RepID=UPI0024BA338A|nr:uncharacterized protein LOC115692375 isoform X2 [Syzygium oleosum]
MEVELEGRVKPLGYKVKATSRESPSQKAAHILDPDLRTHWSTGTNTKEWILLELDEPCLLSHVRIYNKSVLEWEIAAGLRYKPETFAKVRPRCEAPRREMTYPTNYTPCRYVRISCLRGNPIAIFFIQLIGVPVPGLEPEFQPVVSHLLPHIIAHKQDAQDVHLQLLQYMTCRLLPFLPQLEGDLSSFSDAPEPSLRFLAMVAGPFYPILHIVNERETTKSSSNVTDSEVPKNNQPSSVITVSSNFEPRRFRSASPLFISSSTVFRSDAVFVLLRKAYKDSDLGTVCKAASVILQKFIEPAVGQETFNPSCDEAPGLEDNAMPAFGNPFSLTDFCSLFGEEFQMPDDRSDSSYLSILDIWAVEEGIMHVLYASPALQKTSGELCGDVVSFTAYASTVASSDHYTESFSQWRQPHVQRALSQIVMTTSSSLYRPLLHATAGYLSSFSQSHVKAACVLIDLCSSVLAPWMPQVIAKVDLCMELLEDLLGIIQTSRHSLASARTSLKYFLLGLSGHLDDILGKYKEVKHRILFLIEMLEPFLDPAISTFKSTIAFGDVFPNFVEKQESNCETALNIIRTAVWKPAILPSLESEWRSGSVAPSVLLSILEPHMQLPADIDLCKSPASVNEVEATSSSLASAVRRGGASSKASSLDDHDGKVEVSDAIAKVDGIEDAAMLFVPDELRNIALLNVSVTHDQNTSDAKLEDTSSEQKHIIDKSLTDQSKSGFVFDADFNLEYFNLQADYFQLANYRDCELRASEFQRLALDLHSQHEVTAEGHDAAIDALLLAAECYINPFFMSSRYSLKVVSEITSSNIKVPACSTVPDMRKHSGDINTFESIAHLEKKRDKIVLQLLLKAAELDRNYQREVSDDGHAYQTELSDEPVVELSPEDVESADAITLARQNQGLLCNFLIQRLQREQHSMQEILMEGLLFLLHSSTKLCCDPGLVINIILGSAEYFNSMLTSFYFQLKEGNLHLDAERVYELQRRWILLKKLVVATSAGTEGSELKISINNTNCGNLLPPSAWMQKISTFSISASPLVRFLGWMAVSRNAKQYVKDHLFLVSDLTELTYLLSIFFDDLSMGDKVFKREDDEIGIEQLGAKPENALGKGFEQYVQQNGNRSFYVIYPDLCRLLPNMKRQFESFGEIILEAVGLQLRSLPSTVLPDVLCWFSDLCSKPFSQESNASQLSPTEIKGFAATNAKAIILYILEALVGEHMEAMVAETPRLVHMLVSLCRASYCDVLLLDSVMSLLKPIISYSLKKVSDEFALVDNSCLSFESLCFDELFKTIGERSDSEIDSSVKSHGRALTIFILASVFSDLSFQYRRDILQSLLLWVNFTSFEPTSSYHDYICAFQCVMDNCKLLLRQALLFYGVMPLKLSSDGVNALYDADRKSVGWFLNDILHESLTSEVPDTGSISGKLKSLSVEEIKEFVEDMDRLINKLSPTLEQCWMLHHRLTKKLVVSSAESFIYLRCLSAILQNIHLCDDGKRGDSPTSVASLNELPMHWRVGLEGLGEFILVLLERHCWTVASVMVDCLLAVPLLLPIHDIVGTLCIAITRFSCCAPKLSWRLQSDKWLTTLFGRRFHNFSGKEVPVVELFCRLLGHNEPEQRLIALKHLGKIVCQDIDGISVMDYSRYQDKFISPISITDAAESVLPLLVSSTWDHVALMGSSDTSLLLRTRAMALLVDYIPFAGRQQLQCFLASADAVLNGLGKLSYPMLESPFLQLSLALVAGACLYSSEEDISLIPDNLWIEIENLGSSKTEGRIGYLEKQICLALCRLRDKGVEEKEVLREALSASGFKQLDPDFSSTREEILQVLTKLTSAQSYVEAFSRKLLEEVVEQEEAEMELEVLQNENRAEDQFRDTKETTRFNSSADLIKDENRLQQIKNSIHSIEKSRLQEEIIARRQKKLLMRHTRKKFLEEAAVREAELLQELDREKTTEVEKEIERQRLLEIERARTRELRYNLDLEKEKQAQRELQQELEQIESGVRSSRREFPSSAQSSRSRDRYRERDNGRPVNEGSTRAGGGSLQPENAGSSSSMGTMQTVVLSGSRPFAGQPPTILQSRDRADDTGSSYEENFDGSKDSGDTGSIGDGELVSAFDGQPGLYGSAQRHGSRGSKSRQTVERRERDGKREGKWERKH